MTDPVVILIFLPWLVGPLLVRRYDLWRVDAPEPVTVDGFQIADPSFEAYFVA
jgi:hypothetical protein